MIWTSRYRLRQAIHDSLWIVPTFYLVGAVVAGLVIPQLDHSLSLVGEFGRNPDSTRDVLSTIAGGMLAFTGFVLAVVLLIVQFGSATFGPRLVRWARRAWRVKHTLGVFVATFVFALFSLDQVQRGDRTFIPDVTVTIALGLLLASLVMFFLMLDGITTAMRPAAVAKQLSERAHQVLHEVFPDPDDGLPHPTWVPPEGVPMREVTLRGAYGATVVTIDFTAVEEFVERTGVVVELLPAIGEHVRRGSPLFRVYGPDATGLGELERSLMLGDERSVDRDPAFAFRLLVDIAVKALSPAINDPSTAVQVLDWLDGLLRDASARELGVGLKRDGDGRAHIVYRTSTWEDLVALSFEEILFYGRQSTQVLRRLRALLNALLVDLPAHRRPPIEELRLRLELTVAQSFPLEGTRAVASQPDRLGLGMARLPLTEPTS